MDSLPSGAQENRRSLATDKNLRVKGSNGTIFAIGDCATIERPRSMEKALDLYRGAAKCDEDGVCEITLDKATVKAALVGGVAEFPHLEEVVNNIDEVFSTHADAKTGRCSFEGFKAMLTEVDNGLRALPATAQVAKQEGEYLAAFFNACDGDAERLAGDESKFDYVHKGSLAYIGKDAAVADIPGFTIVKGIAAGIIWKSFETISQVSTRNIFLVAADMVRTKIFGRDISRMP
jgi:NADH:ubiquinone reductase (non-electrogenic)